MNASVRDRKSAFFHSDSFRVAGGGRGYYDGWSREREQVM